MRGERPRSTGSSLLRAVAALVLAVVAVQVPQPAALAAPSSPSSPSAPATSAPGSPSSTSAASVQRLCGTPKPGELSCFGLRRTDTRRSRGVQPRTAAATPEGYAPADLLSAYGLPAGGGAGATIAIVDAYDNPRAEEDLAVYRQQYGLPPCTTANGCFRKVDQRGGTDYPEPNGDWAGEISLDVDMASAVAPQAHILLVEADSAYTDDLGTAVNTAVALGAKYVSNSYGSDPSAPEDPSEPAYDEAYFNHPGVAVVASSGDFGYGVSYPASSTYVTAVGGTSLVRDGSARGWSEKVWNTAGTRSTGEPYWGATGSGCSTVETKPTYQADSGCAGRTVADVSAVADPATGVAVYNSYSDEGWNVYGGTSASAPIVAGVYALAGTPVAGSTPASYPYLSPGALHDVTTGDNASCADRSLCGFGPTPECTPRYLCAAGPGYDGPTGLGTPNGLAAFRPGPHATVSGTVTDAATGRPVAGAAVSLAPYATTSGPDGRYQLVVPVGSYPLTVGAFGYAQLDLGTQELADGVAVTRDAALVAVPSQTVAGTVRDGGGHGWGLYARLTVDGVPGTVFTDPRTGAYAVKLPMDRTYTLRVTPLYPGYRSASATVELGQASKRVDITLPIFTTGALAPGYAVNYHGGGLESFATSGTPAGWTVRNNTPAGGWQFDDPLNRGNQTGGTGRFAIVDDYALGWAAADSELISPSYDLSGQTAPVLEFDSALPWAYRLGDLTADVDVSTDGGATWTNVWRHADAVPGPDHETVPLTGYAGRSSVRIRFHFVGSLTGMWQLDNVAVGTRSLDVLPGGLLVGQVTDANTGAGVAGATVRGVAAPADAGRSVASPGDPAVGDGLYWAFSGRTGKQQFTADLAGFGYPAVTAKVTVRPDAITPVDFALAAGRLRVDATAVAADVAWGTTKTVNLQVKNTGGAPATFGLGEQRVGVPAGPATGAPRQRVRSQLTPNGMVASAARAAGGTSARTGAATDQAWQPVTDLPVGVQGGVAAVDHGVLYAGLGADASGQWTNGFWSYDPASATWRPLAHATTLRFAPAYGFVRGKLYVVGGKDRAGVPIPGGEVYDPATDSWSEIAPAPKAYGAAGSAVLGDKLYVVGGCDQFNCGASDVQVYDPATDSWSAGKPYPRPLSYLPCGTVDGVLYCTGGVYQPSGGAPAGTKEGYAFDPVTADWRRIADAPIDVWGAAGSSANGRLLTAGGLVNSTGELTNEAYAYDPAADAWSALPSLNTPVMIAAAAPGWYVLGGQTRYAPTATAQKLPGYDQPHADVPWLAAGAKSLTLRPGQSTTVRVTLDAGAMGPADAGAHAARLLLDSDTPYGSVAVPLTMTVTAPAGWGQLTGTVTGRGADGGAVPLAGAIVQVETKAGNHTLVTDADGRYRLWLPARDNPLTVVVAATGYAPTTRTVRIVRDGTVTADFPLTQL
ncbi:carboxypeptidase regulatory-like domain-containing protein [Micromonospora sp. NPDC049559]|uniref:carboxypeptidase regulatory-like domain-containing protein n=1 Tax=Micromonospora sp. NPDC049559 TaxID=3155923 RepID=UPI00341AD4AC